MSCTKVLPQRSFHKQAHRGHGHAQDRAAALALMSPQELEAPRLHVQRVALAAAVAVPAPRALVRRQVAAHGAELAGGADGRGGRGGGQVAGRARRQLVQHCLQGRSQ